MQEPHSGIGYRRVVVSRKKVGVHHGDGVKDVDINHIVHNNHDQELHGYTGYVEVQSLSRRLNYTQRQSRNLKEEKPSLSEHEIRTCGPGGIGSRGAIASEKRHLCPTVVKEGRET